MDQDIFQIDHEKKKRKWPIVVLTILILVIAIYFLPLILIQLRNQNGSGKINISEKDLLQAIQDYWHVINSDLHWYTVRFTFERFLEKGYEKFLPCMKPKEAFLDEKKKKRIKNKKTTEDWMNETI